MYRLLLVCIVLFAAELTSAQNSDRIAYTITGISGNDLSNMLPVGTYSVQSIDSIKSTPRYKELVLKVEQGVQKNFEWYMEYVKTQKDGKPLPYHPNLGLTEAEYAEIKGSMESFELVPVDAGIVQIIGNSNMLTFKGEGKLDILNYVTVDVTNSIVTFGKYRMHISDTLDIKDGKNPNISPRKGYTWVYTDPKDITTVDFNNLKSLNVTSLEFEVSRLSISGKTFLHFKGVQVIDGVKTMNFELPIVF